MSGKHFGRNSSDYEQQLNQLILLLKAQKLGSKPIKPAIDERHKRLHNDYNIVDGRKLDWDKYKSASKFAGPGISRHCVWALEKESEKKVSKAVSEQLKNFKFNFPLASETTKGESISAKLGYTQKTTRQKPEVYQKGDAPSKKKTIESQAKTETQRQKTRQVSQHQTNYMYFVLDTNVLIDNRSLLDEVANLTLRDTAGSILYIPYIVIKELDLLKCKQTTSFAARRAIEYLNDKFDDREPIEAQSALEDAEQLIEIDSADDSIINCCLQLKDELEHMILLTNDNNLRLKALASDIRVSTCYQLISCRGNWWSLPRERPAHRRQKYRVRY